MKTTEFRKLIQEEIKAVLKEEKYWMGDVPKKDDFGYPIVDEFFDGKTKQGPWALMSYTSWKIYSVRKLGTGYGQRYKKQSGGKWLKVEG